MEIFDNVTKIVKQDMEVTITKGSCLDIAAACFSVYAFQELAAGHPQVGDITLPPGCGLDEQIKLNAEREALEKKIAKLEKLVRAEKQPKRKFELVQEAQALRNNVEA